MLRGYPQMFGEIMPDRYRVVKNDVTVVVRDRSSSYCLPVECYIDDLHDLGASWAEVSLLLAQLPVWP